MMKKIELIMAIYITTIGIGLAIVTQLFNIMNNTQSAFEISTTMILCGLAYYVVRGGIEMSIREESSADNKTISKDVQE